MKHWNRRIALGLIFCLLISGRALFSVRAIKKVLQRFVWNEESSGIER